MEINLEGRLKMADLVASEIWSTIIVFQAKMELSTRKLLMKASGKLGKGMVKARLLGLMEAISLVYGKTILVLREKWDSLTVTFIKENFWMTRCTDTVVYSLRRVLFLKEISTRTFARALVNFFIWVVIFTLDSIEVL